MSYSKLPVWQFGARLLETQDLDPVYVGVAGAALPREQLHRWLLAYWCFYHVGSASWLSEHEGKDFWSLMIDAAENKITPADFQLPTTRWPRAPERRHFRGDKCVEAMRELQARNALKELARLAVEAKTFDFVMMQVQVWPLFGPWIAFKAADMLERVANAPLLAPDNLGLIYSEPRKALDRLAAGRATEYPEADEATRDAQWWWDRLLLRFSHAPAPPVRAGGRRCGPQEVETILCKWKSHDDGRYPVGKDTHETRGDLVGWGETAEKMLRKMPAEVAL